MQDAVGDWLVDTLGFCSPDSLTSRFLLDPEDPALDYLESFVLKQIAVRVLQLAAGGSLYCESRNFPEDRSMGLSSLGRSVLRIVGADASDEVQESIVRYVDERGPGSVRVSELVQEQALPTIPLDLQPPKEAILVCFAAKFKAVEDGLTQWFAYVALIELLLDWLGRDQIGGAPSGFPQRIHSDLDRLIGQQGVALVSILEHLSSLHRKPLFFQSVAQFWGAFGVYDILVAIIGMTTVRHRYSFRTVLTRLQEDLRKEGTPEHTLWVYDELDRRQFHKAVSLGVEVNLEISFVQINPEVLRDAKVYRLQFDRLLSKRSWRSFGLPNRSKNVLVVSKTLVYDSDGVLQRGKQKKLVRSAWFRQT